MSTFTLTPATSSAARQLEQNPGLLTRSLGRLAAQAAAAIPPDVAAPATESKFDAQKLRLQAARTNVQDAVSYGQSADHFLGQLENLVSSLTNLRAAEASAPNAAVKFSALQDQLRAIIGGGREEIGGLAASAPPTATFKGTALFGPDAGSAVVRRESTAADIVVPASPLRAGAMQDLLQQDAAGNYALSLADDRTPGTLVAAQVELGARRAALAAALTQIHFVGQGLLVESANLSARVVPLRDFASAQAAAHSAQAAFLSAPLTARAAQGQPTPESVFKLLS
jgi:flagellin